MAIWEIYRVPAERTRVAIWLPARRAVRVELAVGLAGGLILAFLGTRFLSSLLFGVGPTDPITFVVVTLVLSGITLLATWLPARRAARVDPMTALRME